MSDRWSKDRYVFTLSDKSLHSMNKLTYFGSFLMSDVSNALSLSDSVGDFDAIP